MTAKAGKAMLSLILPMNSDVSNINDIPGWEDLDEQSLKNNEGENDHPRLGKNKTQKNARGKGRH